METALPAADSVQQWCGLCPVSQVAMHPNVAILRSKHRVNPRATAAQPLLASAAASWHGCSPLPPTPAK